ncbi:MAG: calcium-binding protein [Mycobacteriaceae bacterium]|nr:calcium-binding protein [Mycobacteriaceae bacterium]
MEISAFLDRKLARRFDTFDTDGNGVIERDDFTLAATRLADEFRQPFDSPHRMRMLALSEQLWDVLSAAADSDSDGGITLAEYKAAFADGLLVTEDNFDAGYRPVLEAVMTIADADGDGKLGADEYVRWTGAWMGLSAPVARAVHGRLDSDRDGVVSVDTVLGAIRDYYFDEAPDSAGGWLLGPLPAN